MINKSTESMMETGLSMSREEARMYSMILDAVSQLPKSDPRYALVVGVTWWLVHRRRRMEQQRIRRRQFYRRWKRILLLRWESQRSMLAGFSSSMKSMELAALEELDLIPEKRLWVKKDRSDDFWSKIEHNELIEEEFRRSFHMSEETFNFIYQQLNEHLTKANTSMREALPGKKRLAATLYRLAHNAEYCLVSNLFGIGKSTTTSLVKDVCDVIVTNLKHKYLSFSSILQEGKSMSESVELSGLNFEIPNCVGFYNLSDVLILGSSWDWSKTNPFGSSYAKSSSLIFQAVVDSHGRFLFVGAGLPGGLSNEEALSKSKLETSFKKLQSPEEGPTSEGDEEEIEEKESKGRKMKIPPLLVGSQNVPFKNWLLTPFFEDANVDQMGVEKTEMNLRIEKAGMIFEDALRNLKKRWEIFHGKKGRINFNSDSFELIAHACAILHNICEERGDVVDNDWIKEEDIELFIREGPVEEPREDSTDDELEIDTEFPISSDVRNAVAAHILAAL